MEPNKSDKPSTPTTNEDEIMKVQADAINGVYEVRDLSDFNAPEVFHEDFFYRYLADLCGDGEMASTLSPEMAEKIDAEYGIKRI